MTRRRLVVGLAVLALGGCGFRPVYAPGAAKGTTGAAAGLSQINVVLIPERPGQLLRQDLMERFDRGDGSVNHRFDLQVSLSISSDQLSIQPNNTNTRTRMSATARWVLLAQDAERRTVTSGVARTVDGFDNIDLQYFYSDTTNDSATRRMTSALADQITTQIASFFNTHDLGG